jgi:serine/threonine-protein kinase RsbW
MVVNNAEDDLTAAPSQVRLQISNQLNELIRLSNWVADLSAELGLSSRTAFSLDLVLAEAVTNVMENAYVDDQPHIITVVVTPRLPLLQIQIRDDGQPFNPLDYPEVVPPKSLSAAKEGGLGIHLIRNYAQECHYQRQGQENWFTIVLKNGV